MILFDVTDDRTRSRHVAHGNGGCYFAASRNIDSVSYGRDLPDDHRHADNDPSPG